MLERIMQQQETMVFEFDGPKPALSQTDREGLSMLRIGTDEDGAGAKAIKQTIALIANAGFPQGMARADAKIYAAWLDAIDVGPSVAVTRGMVEWLRRIAQSDDLRLPAVYSRLRESLCDYLDALTQATHRSG